MLVSLFGRIQTRFFPLEKAINGQIFTIVSSEGSTYEVISEIYIQKLF